MTRSARSSRTCRRSNPACGFALALALALAAPASAQTELAWKLVPGQSFEMDRAATYDQAVELRSKLFKQREISTWRVQFEVLQQSPGTAVPGLSRVRATLREVEHKIKGSVGPGADHSLADKLQGRVFVLVNVTPRGTVEAMDGYEEFIAAAAGAHAERRRALRTLLPEATLRQALGDFFGPLPEAKVRPGSTWQHRLREPIPHFGALVETWHFTAEDASPAGYPLAYTITTAYQPPKDDDAPLFPIVKGDLRSENGRGKVLFDAERGRLLRHQRHNTVRGTLTADIMGVQTPLALVSEEKIEIKSR